MYYGYTYIRYVLYKCFPSVGSLLFHFLNSAFWRVELLN